MRAELQRRVQRYGWDRAADDYEPLWRALLAPAHRALLAAAALRSGEVVLDVACGSGLVSLPAAQRIGARGHLLGIDLSGRMVELATRRVRAARCTNAAFVRMDAERLDLGAASFDVVLCALGLMYLPDPARALAEMRRVLRPGGRIALAVWGERSACGWAPVFPIVDAEVSSEVCPLFFRLGQRDTLARELARAGFAQIATERLATTLDHADADAACDAALVGGPVALAWSRFDAPVRERVRARYLDAIAPWRQGSGYRLPGEFVIASATASPSSITASA
jgi:ubiquinone/menaquinone biosynthesis C-methylase UbiE